VNVFCIFGRECCAFATTVAYIFVGERSAAYYARQTFVNCRRVIVRWSGLAKVMSGVVNEDHQHFFLIHNHKYHSKVISSKM
jgi:Na+/alanine symporter